MRNPDHIPDDAPLYTVKDAHNNAVMYGLENVPRWNGNLMLIQPAKNEYRALSDLDVGEHINIVGDMIVVRALKEQPMPKPTRFRVEENKPYILRMPCSEAMMSLRAHGHLQLLRVQKEEVAWGTLYVIEFGSRFILNYPNNPYNFSGHYADISELLQNLDNVQWRDPGYTYSEVGLFRDEEGLYGYLPDMSEEPEAIQRQAAEFTESLRVIFHNANAERIE